MSLQTKATNNELSNAEINTVFQQTLLKSAKNKCPYFSDLSEGDYIYPISLNRWQKIIIAIWQALGIKSPIRRWQVLIMPESNGKSITWRRIDG